MTMAHFRKPLGTGTLNRNIISAMSWAFGRYWPEDAGAPYQLSVTIDNLAWLP
jgi:hypothetical protein